MKQYLLLLAACLLVIVGCHRQKQSGTFQYTDDYGTSVSVPQSPKRIVSMSPAVTEIIFALGAEDLLVGRTDFCSYPPQVSEIESMGGISNLNIEKILSVNPDLVISGSMIPQKSVQHLANMGVPMVCVIEKNSFDSLYSNIQKIGQLVNHSQAADSLVTLLQQRMASLDTLPLPYRPSVYYVVGFGAGGNFTAGGDTFINDIITMAGGENIASDVKGWNYSLEALMEKDPDFVIVRREDSALFSQTKPYNQLSAVKKHHVIGIESGTIDLQVPRNIDCILTLRKIFSER